MLVSGIYTLYNALTPSNMVEAVQQLSMMLEELKPAGSEHHHGTTTIKELRASHRERQVLLLAFNVK